MTSTRTKPGLTVEALEDRRVASASPAAVSTYSFSSTYYRAAEGQGLAAVTVTRTGNLDNFGSVEFATGNGSAQAGGDYLARGGPADPGRVLTFAPGETTKTIALTIYDDVEVEGNETFTVRLLNPDGQVAGAAQAVVTIDDDDGSRNQQFVAAAYQLLLGRAVDAAGLQGWTDFLDNGGSQQSLAAAIVTSNEYRARELTGMYRSFLGREPDEGGLQLGLQLYAAGFTREQQAARLLGSDEYYAKNGGTQDGFIDAMYRDVLGRPADAGGKAVFAQYLASGASRELAGYAVAVSAEAYGLRVRSLYGTLLTRTPGDDEVAFWVTRLRSGDTDENVIVQFAGSPEFGGLY